MDNKEKRKITFVTQNVAPFRIEWLEELSHYYDIEVFHLNDYHKSVNKEYLVYNSESISVISDVRYFFGIKTYNNRRIIQSCKDILILDGYGFAGQVFLIFILKLRKMKFLLSLDGGFIPKKENFLKRCLKMFCLNAPAAFLSTSEQTDEFIRYYCYKKRPIYRHFFSSLHVNDLHFPTASEKQNYKQQLNLKGKFVVISVGRFVAIKAMDRLLKAMSSMDDDSCLLLVGGNPTEEYLEIVRDYPIGKVEFVGFMSKERLKEYYCAADAFAIASRGEIWGLVVGEAMAYGLPIISSDKCNASLAMIGDKNGILVDDDNPETYAKCFFELKQDQARREMMGENNFKKIRKYTIEESTKNDVRNIDDFIKLIGLNDGDNEK